MYNRKLIIPSQSLTVSQITSVTINEYKEIKIYVGGLTD